MSPIVLGNPLSSQSDLSYITLDEADTYCLHVADATAWTAAEEHLQAAALVQASEEIDTLQLAGRKYASDQVRAFPRVAPVGSVPITHTRYAWPNNCRLWDSDAEGQPIVPDAVKRACFHQAISILGDAQRRSRLQDRADGVTAQSGGGLSESYDAASPPQLVCLASQRLMRPYLLKSGDLY